MQSKMNSKMLGKADQYCVQKVFIADTQYNAIICIVTSGRTSNAQFGIVFM